MALISAAALLLGGCAHFQSADTPAEVATRRTLDGLQAANAGLVDCKGLGRVTLGSGAQAQRARLAWAARAPDKLRLELLAVTGHPLATLASDGAHLYLRDATTGRYYKNRSTQISLERLVHVPLRVNDLVAYLMGRIPIAANERVVQMDNPHQPGYILELRRWWGEVSQRIMVKPDAKTITRVVKFAAEGEIAYQVDLSHHGAHGGFLFARQLSASTPAGDRIDIVLERFWPNAGIDEGAFRLTP